MRPILFGADKPSHAAGTHTIIQDMKSPTRATVVPEEDAYHVFPLPILFAWSTISVEPAVGSTCTVFFTISSPEAIRSGDAIWHEWDHGEVGEAAWHEWENPWMAVRLDCTGPTRIEIATKYL